MMHPCPQIVAFASIPSACGPGEASEARRRDPLQQLEQVVASDLDADEDEAAGPLPARALPSSFQVQILLLQLFMHSLLKVQGSPGLPSEQKFSEIRQMSDMQSLSLRQESPTVPSQHRSLSQ
jgi:hypothetical protein